MTTQFVPRILVLATEACAYPGADAVGKAHQEYGSNVYILRVRSPVLFPEDFYLRSYARGIDGIMIAACGTDCPFHNAYDALARRIDALTAQMKDGEMPIARIRLTAICTVCIKAFLKETAQLNERLTALGPVDRDRAARLWQESLARLRETPPVANVMASSAIEKGSP